MYSKIVSKMKKKPTEWKKISSKYTFNRGLVSWNIKVSQGTKHHKTKQLNKKISLGTKQSFQKKKYK